MQSNPATIDPRLLVRGWQEDGGHECDHPPATASYPPPRPLRHDSFHDSFPLSVAGHAASCSQQPNDTTGMVPHDHSELHASTPTQPQDADMAPLDAADSCLPLIWDSRSTDSLQRAREPLNDLARPHEDVYDEQLDYAQAGDGSVGTDPPPTDQSQLPLLSNLDVPSSDWTTDYQRVFFTPIDSRTGDGQGDCTLTLANLVEFSVQADSCYWPDSSGISTASGIGPAMSGPDGLLNTTPLVSRRRSAPVVPAFQGSASITLTSSSLDVVGRPVNSVPDAHLRPRRHSDKQTTKPTMSAPLNVIHENGDGRHRKGSHRIGGRRSGPLAASTRENAHRCRRQKSICIRCKKDRQPCIRTGDGPCSRCVHLGLTSQWQQPCTKASFLEIVEYGTCNYISQRAVNHLTVDGQRRVRIDLPETLDLDKLLQWVDAARDRFDVRVRQQTGSLYVLNLRQFQQYLSAIRKSQPSGKQDLRGFIDHGILSASGWQQCVDECSPLADLMACLSTWSNMPSRASYSYIRSAEHGSGDREEETMDVEDDHDRETITMASQLSRIVCRKLEVDAYTHLQRVLNSWSTMSAADLLQFARQLGLVLLTLRWRVSWWNLLGSGGDTPDPKGREAFAYRVNRLCRVLYFYFCMLRRKLPAWSSSKELYGVWSKYPDTSLPVFEGFPSEESIDGFHRWMREGVGLIERAGVEGKLAGIGLRHERLVNDSSEGKG